MNLGVAITGDKHVDAALRDFPKVARRKAIRQTTRDVVKLIVLPSARDFATEETGRLSRSLRVRVAKGARGRRLPRHIIGHSVVWTDDRAYYGSFQELGTKHIDDPAKFLRYGLYKNAHLLRSATIRLIKPRIAAVASELRSKR